MGGEEEERRVERGLSGDEEGKGEEGEGGEEEREPPDGCRERGNGCSSKRDLDFPGEGRFERS